jgi:hypothetical protein
MRAWVLLVLLAGAEFLGCVLLADPPPNDRQPAADGDSSMVRLRKRMAVQLDPERRERLLAERFPGVERLEALEVAVWPHARSGACWSELDRLDAAQIDVTWKAEEGEDRHARSLPELLSERWIRIYRSPAGEGFERTGRLDSLDVALRTTLRCLCAPRDTIESGDLLPLTLRVRWSEGKHPELSAVATRDGKRDGLVPAMRVGRLVSWEFPAEGRFPARRHGNCGATIGVTMLIDPPLG